MQKEETGGQYQGGRKISRKQSRWRRMREEDRLMDSETKAASSDRFSYSETALPRQPCHSQKTEFSSANLQCPQGTIRA